MIDAITRERILEAANIVDVVSEFVTLRKRGVNFVGLCPFHTDKTPSFYVSPAKNICKCFACGEGGSPVYFIMKHEQLSYQDALRFLARKYHIEVRERELTDEEKRSQSDRESMFVLNSWAQKHFTSRLLDHEEGRVAGLSYFVQRGFRDETIRKFQLGYSLEKRDDLYQSAIGKGYRREYLEKTGLVTFYDDGVGSDRFRGRVIFPIHTLSGKVVGFGGRVLDQTKKTAKYLNSPESEIYHKSNELYGLYFAKQAIAKADKCFLVEGYTDVISMHQSGIENVVASSGTALTQRQIHLIHRMTNNITVLYDGDAAGIKAAIRGIDLLLEEGMNVKVLLLPDGEDPDSFARSRNAFEFSVYIQEHETDFIRFKTQLLLDEAGNDPLKRASLISDILHSIAVIPDNIIRSVYLKECSHLLEIKEPVLLAELNKIRAQRRRAPSLYRVPSPPPPPPVDPSSARSASSEGEEPPSPAPASEGEHAPETDSVEQSVAPTSQKRTPPAPYQAIEEALLRYVVSQGELVLYDYTDEASGERVVIRVAEYIREELQKDHLVFSTPLFCRMLEEAVDHCRYPGFKAESYFSSHPDPAVSYVATNLAGSIYQIGFGNETPEETATEPTEEEREEMNRRQMKMRERAIVRDLFALKGAHLLQQIAGINKKIKELQAEGRIDEAIEQMKEQKRLNEIKLALSKELGERIILKM